MYASLDVDISKVLPTLYKILLHWQTLQADSVYTIKSVSLAVYSYTSFLNAVSYTDKRLWTVQAAAPPGLLPAYPCQ